MLVRPVFGDLSAPTSQLLLFLYCCVWRLSILCHSCPGLARGRVLMSTERRRGHEHGYAAETSDSRLQPARWLLRLPCPVARRQPVSPFPPGPAPGHPARLGAHRLPSPATLAASGRRSGNRGRGSAICVLTGLFITARMGFRSAVKPRSL